MDPMTMTPAMLKAHKAKMAKGGKMDKKMAAKIALAERMMKKKGMM